MINVFNRKNIDEVVNKKPLIVYYSENGACGPSGLFFALFSDRSCYGYSTYYEKTDVELIHSIIEHVPELRTLLRIEGEYDYKRDNTLEDMELAYLGLGNWGLIHNSLYDKIDEYEGQYFFGKFKQLVEDNIDGDIKSIFELVRKEING